MVARLPQTLLMGFFVSFLSMFDRRRAMFTRLVRVIFGLVVIAGLMMGGCCGMMLGRLMMPFRRIHVMF